MRNMLGTLLLSQGTPMIVAGDEFARTQKGNNNAYCQDNEISWVDWSLRDKNNAQVKFVQKLMALRHKFPILRHSRFLTAEINPETEVKAISWINANGSEMTAEEWGDGNTRCFGMLMDGRAQSSGIQKRGLDATMLLVMNSWQDAVNFTLPPAPEGASWILLIDTNSLETEPHAFAFGAVYEVTARSLLLFLMKPPPAEAAASEPVAATS
jgi:glycogen operon protein